MPSPRVLILYNEPVLPPEHPDSQSEQEILQVVGEVGTTLGRAGFRLSRLGLGDDPTVLLDRIKAQRPAAVFNLHEGHPDQGHTEAYIAGLLEFAGVPFTGCPSETLALCRAKHLTKLILRGAGFPTPDFFVVDELPVPECTLDWPVIVKPALQDASVGMDQNSVVTNQAGLVDRVEYLLNLYGPPVLVERYIRGKEIIVALVELPELRALPPSEISFQRKESRGYWQIVTYDGKWKRGSDEYESSPPRYPADISSEVAAKLAELAKEVFRLFGCRDYARIDMRVRPSGKPYILEVNPNPDISAEAGFAGCLHTAKLDYQTFLSGIVRNAIARTDQAAAAAPPLFDKEQFQRA